MLPVLLLLLASAAAVTATPTTSTTPITDVHIIYSNHLDVGFDGIAPTPGFSHNVVQKYFHEYFPRAVETAKNVTRDSAGQQTYQWMTQCWLISLYLDCPPNMGFDCPTSEEQQALRDAINAGTIYWHAFPFNSQMETMNYEMAESGVQLCHSLNDEFSQPHALTLSQRDVPGMTRAMVPLLVRNGVQAISVGVNGFTAPPAFPPASTWFDWESGESILLFYHPGGYGGINISDAVQIPGFSHILIMDWNTDNHGPYYSDIVLQHVAQIQAEYPGANVYSSTFDAYVNALQNSGLQESLPVINLECGDSWSHGEASDPLKLSRFRTVQRFRSACLADSTCDSTSYQFMNFSRLLLKASEHTWGGDIKTFLNVYETNTTDQTPYFNWSNSEFHALRVSGDWDLGQMEDTWLEQREWGLQFALDALPATHPIKVQSLLEFQQMIVQGEIQPPAGFIQQNLTNGPITFETNTLSFFICPMWGDIGNLTDLTTGIMWSTMDQTLGSVLYQTFTEQDFLDYISTYGMCDPLDPKIDCGWAEYDFGKKGLDADAQPVRQDVKPAVQSVWSSTSSNNGSDTIDILVNLVFPPSLVSNYGAPSLVQIFFHVSSFTISLDVLLINKTATRIPEALWVQFNPVRDNTLSNDWVLEKMDSHVRVGADTIIQNGSQTIHSIWSGGSVLAGPPENMSQLSIQTIDAPIVCIAPEEKVSPFPVLTSSIHSPPGTDAMSVNLVNNIWGTNYIFWYPYLEEEANSRFRMSIEIHPFA